jgi:ribose 5-phosphate isomerase B
MQIGVAADHEGFELKQGIVAFLRHAQYEVVDFGAPTLDGDDDYPDFVIPMAKAVSCGELRRGIAICGTGIGACIASNKVKHIRAGLIHDLFSAHQGVEDDNMNIVCLGARLVTLPQAIEFVQCFLGSRFSEKPRHKRRLEKISSLEENENRL